MKMEILYNTFNNFELPIARQGKQASEVRGRKGDQFGENFK